jgi:hypothetical protein
MKLNIIIIGTMKQEMIFAFLLTLALTMAVLSVLFLPNIGLAATGDVTIYVNVSTTAAISVQPTVLSWLLIAPGNNGTDQTLTITNTGGTAFSTGVYASVNSFAKETSNPLGSTNPTSYASAGFLVLKNATDTTYYFVNRMEWNDSTITDSVQNKDTYGISWGFLRNMSQNFLWEISKDNASLCLNGSASNTMHLHIKTVADTGSNRDITDSIAIDTFSANTTEWSVWTFSDGPLQNYCAAIARNCQRFMLYRWDKNGTLPSCTNTRYLNATLNPSSQLLVTANVWVPSGIPAGDTLNSTLTITAI